MRKWLKKSRISQADLARSLGLTRQTVNGKVNGWMSWTQRDLN
ncbi:winged helix-turn-helix transcriptional regulator [Alloscardovia omnicolens]